MPQDLAPGGCAPQPVDPVGPDPGGVEHAFGLDNRRGADLEAVAEGYAPAPARAVEAGDGRVIAREGTHAHGIENGVEGDALGPLVAELAPGLDAAQLRGLAQPFEERRLACLGRAQARGAQRHAALGGQGRDQAEPEPHMPGTVGAVLVDREAEGEAVQPLGHGGGELRARGHGVARPAQVAQEVARAEKRLPDRGLAVAEPLARLEEAQPAMEQAARPAARPARKIALVDDENAVALRRQVLGGADPADPGADDGHVERAAIELVEWHALHLRLPLEFRR